MVVSEVEVWFSELRMGYLGNRKCLLTDPETAR